MLSSQAAPLLGVRASPLEQERRPERSGHRGEGRLIPDSLERCATLAEDRLGELGVSGKQMCLAADPAAVVGTHDRLAQFVVDAVGVVKEAERLVESLAEGME